jgi:hypothetical protein
LPALEGKKQIGIKFANHIKKMGKVERTYTRNYSGILSIFDEKNPAKKIIFIGKGR